MIVSKQKNKNQLRVSLPKVVKSTTVNPYDENRICFSEKVPIPDKLVSSDFNGVCQLEGHSIVNINSKCYQAILKIDAGNFLFATSVMSTTQNPRLYSLPGFADRLKIECYDSWGYSKMSDFVDDLEKVFGIKIKVPAPDNLQDIKYQQAPRPPPSPVAI